jgi:hypothetical protein
VGVTFGELFLPELKFYDPCKTRCQPKESRQETNSFPSVTISQIHTCHIGSVTTSQPGCNKPWVFYKSFTHDIVGQAVVSMVRRVVVMRHRYDHMYVVVSPTQGSMTTPPPWRLSDVLLCFSRVRLDLGHDSSFIVEPCLTLEYENVRTNYQYRSTIVVACLK